MHLCIILYTNPTRCTVYSQYIYQSLNVSADYGPFIRRNNSVFATLGTCYSMWMTVWYAGAYAHTVFLCVLCGSQSKHRFFSLYGFNWLIFIVEMESVYCAVQVGLIRVNLSLRSAHRVYLCVLCGSENKQRLFPYTTLTDWFFITEMVSVYYAVRIGCPYKTDYVSWREEG